MDTEHVKTFLLVAKTKNFSLSASYLHLSQPAVTNRIKALEDELGGKLFVRSGKHLEITVLGLEFLRFAEKINELTMESRGLFNTTFRSQPQLSIGCTPLLGTAVVPHLVQTFQQQVEHLKVHIIAHQTELLLQHLIEQRIDVVFATSKVENPELQYTELFEDPVVLVCNRKDLPDSAPDGFTLSDIQHRNVIYLRANVPDYWTKIMEYFAEQAFRLPYSLETNNIDTIKAFLAMGGHFAFLPRMSIQRELESGELILVPFLFRQPIFCPVYLVVAKRESPHAVTTIQFYEFVQAYYARPRREFLPLE